jgi:hypothetical protein
MSAHHDDAEEVLHNWYYSDDKRTQLEALEAAGLAVVRVGEPPPWMPDDVSAYDPDCACGYAYKDRPAVITEGESADAPEEGTDG